jgi:hypothetical protein
MTCSQRSHKAVRDIVFALAVFVIARSNAEEPSAPSWSTVRQTSVIALSPSGELAAFIVPEPAHLFEERRVQSILSEHVSTDLELTREQADQLKRAAKRIDRLRELFNDFGRAVSESGAGGREAHRISNSIAEERESLHRAVRDCLLPHQQRRLAQVEVRQEAIETGLETALLWRLAVDDSRDNLVAALRTTFRDLRSKASFERLQVHRKMRDELTKILTTQQRKQFDEEVGDNPKYLAPSLEILRWQLVERHPTRATNGELSPLDELYFSPTWFRVALSGGIERASRAPAGDAFRQFWETWTAPLYGGIDIVDFQMLDAAAPTEEERERSRIMREKLGDLNRQFAQRTISQEFVTAEGSKLIDNFHRWRITSRVEDLLPHQQRDIQRVTLRRLITVRGTKQCLTDGALGKLLQVSSDQRRLIDEMATRVCAMVEESSRKMEQDIWASTLATLPAEKRKLITDALGPTPIATGFAPSPDLLLREP